MKKTITCIAVLLVLSVVGWTMLAHAGDLAVLPMDSAAEYNSIPEVSTEFEVTVTFPTTTVPLLLNRTVCTMRYKSTAQLSANKEVTWESDNPAVVTIDENGELTAVGRGTATVCAADKEGGTATCTVTVRYTLWQWIIRIFLFGWIWY